MHNKQYVLVTGATSGIGLELAKVFAEHGFGLIIVARNEITLAPAAKQLSKFYDVPVHYIVADLYSQTEAKKIPGEIRNRGLTVDILVNNAGQGLYGKFVETDLDQELAMLQLNIGAYIILTKYYLKEMVTRKKGRILNVASIAGKVPGPYQSVYHGTKAFVHSFTEAIRAEVQGSGVVVTSLLPGATDTDFFNKAHMEQSKMLEQELSNAGEVARAGFEALMDGDDMVIPGAKWKAQNIASHLMSDSALANLSMKQQGPK